MQVRVLRRSLFIGPTIKALVHNKEQKVRVFIQAALCVTQGEEVVLPVGREVHEELHAGGKVLVWRLLNDMVHQEELLATAHALHIGKGRDSGVEGCTTSR